VRMFSMLRRLTQDLCRLNSSVNMPERLTRDIHWSFRHSIETYKLKRQARWRMWLRSTIPTVSFNYQLLGYQSTRHELLDLQATTLHHSSILPW